MMSSDRLLVILLAALGLLALLLGLDLGDDDGPELPGGGEAATRAAATSPGSERARSEPRPGPEVEAAAATEGRAHLELRFCSEDPGRVEGIALNLVRIEEGRTSRVATVTTGSDGLALFTDLRPGSYRWLHDGSRLIVPVPPNEKAAVAAEGERVVVRPGEDLSSGLLRLEAGDRRRILVPLPVGARLSGRVMDAGGVLGRDLALKLLTRERFIHPAGTEVERILARQARLFASGEFRFDYVRPGAMELLGYWRDGEGLSQLRVEFELAAGETRDLGALRARTGREVAVRLRAVDAEGRALGPETIFGATEVQRVVELRPREPDPDWPYQKIELPQGRSFELRGLPESELLLSAAREDGLVNPPRAGWSRVGPPEFRIAAEAGAELELVERWGRIAPLRVRLLDAEKLRLPPQGVLLHLIDLDGGLGTGRRLRLADGMVELRVPEGRYRVILGDLSLDSFRQADSGEFRLGVEGRVLDLISAPAGRVQARLRGSGRGGALRIGLDRPGGEIRVAADAEGRVSLDLPPGRHRLYDPERELAVAADRAQDLGELDGD